MKKLICFFAILGIGCALYAFDPPLNGSWGLIMPGDNNEIIWFNYNEIRLFNKLFQSDEYAEADDTIYINDYDGEAIMIQYYLLAPNKLLFILTNMDDSSETMTMILTKL